MVMDKFFTLKVMPYKPKNIYDSVGSYFSKRSQDLQI